VRFRDFYNKYRELPRIPSDSVDLVGLVGLIERNEIFYSSPLSFNDAHEGIVSYKLSSDPVLVREAMTAVASRVLGIPREAAAAHIDNLQLADQHALKERLDRSFQSAMKRAGVFSMSETCRSPQMWAYYASGNAGVCVQLATHHSLRPLALAERVSYLDEKPLIDLMLAFALNKLGDHFLETLTGKADRWSHEQEWRLIHRGSNETERLGNCAVSAVILGTKVTAHGHAVLRNLLRKRALNGLPAPRIARAKIDPTRFKLRIEYLAIDDPFLVL
jgi:hypothetical protein